MVFVVSTKCEEPLKLMAKSLSSRLYKYTGYVDAVILHYKVLQDSSFVSFKFQAEEVPLSIFGRLLKIVLLCLPNQKILKF